MNTHTVQELLAERRSNVIERMRTPRSDRTAKALLAHHIAEIDREIARRHTATGAKP